MWLLPSLAALIVNTATGCCSCGLLWAECSHSYTSAPCFDSKVNVQEVLKDSPCLSLELSIDHDEKLDDSCCAKKLKWEWVPVKMEVKVCEEVKKECPSMQFYERYPYFHKNYHRLHRF